ncbi:hypothetical protein [Clostridium perfringens]|uniref:Uncharacterized protein n=2 Tax=Clostridium perfringens TaxID=1502 RepID=A0A8H9UXE2_CLOPF|nr:hypothetical protein [Clostridium perfringens]MDU7143483.1 hypothetical protein [Anaerococcus vaginalis]MDU7942447.1 hypothetical protein [Streptococcus salivarius]MDU7977689.1 hypothetical protein [Clostridioides difficile]EDT15845.1 hypothetical protein AC3_A0109 [Clostridium perfringens E str. JGS1987]EGS5728040.1 hypothetical protein [Clostridium perfringens]
MKEYQITLKLKEEEEMLIFNEKNEPSITYLGYNYMNNVVNASVHMPDTILIDGNIKENPYIVSNDSGVLEVTANAIAFCKFNGGIVSASATVKFNTEVALTNALMEIVALDKKAGQLIKTGSEKEDNSSIIRKINDHLSLKVFLNNDKVVRAISEYTANKATGERKAISIAQRNALKKLPPFATPIKNIFGMEGSRIGEVTLTLYGDEDNNKIIDILGIAKNINANVMKADLINVDTGEIIEVSEINNKSTEPTNNIVTEDYGTQKAIRDSLVKRYRKLPEGAFNTAAELLFSSEKVDFKTISNEEIELIISCAEKLKNN